jgi:hypothetical protein
MVLSVHVCVWVLDLGVPVCDDRSVVWQAMSLCCVWQLLVMFVGHVY